MPCKIAIITSERLKENAKKEVKINGIDVEILCVDVEIATFIKPAEVVNLVFILNYKISFK